MQVSKLSSIIPETFFLSKYLYNLEKKSIDHCSFINNRGSYTSDYASFFFHFGKTGKTSVSLND